jgi:hypothetical protein
MIREEGAAHLARLIAGNPRLRAVVCIHNNIAQPGLKLLRDALEHNTTLISLQVRPHQRQLRSHIVL